MGLAVTVGIAEERKNIVLQREVEQHSQDETHFPLPDHFQGH